MALQHISEVRTPPCAIVICSNSRSVLSFIRSDSTSAREDLVLEIGTVVHQLITRGTEVRVPVGAGACLPLGQRDGGQGSHERSQGVESQTIDLKLGLSDICSKLTRRLWGKLGENFRAQSTAKERLDPSPPSRVRSLLPRSTHTPRSNHVPATRGLLADHVCARALCMRRSDILPACLI